MNIFGYTVSNELKWILELLIPICLAILGWIYVAWSNRKHLRNEKRIIIKMQAYEAIKDILNDCIRACSDLQFFMFQTSTILGQMGFDINEPLYRVHSSKLISEFENKTINKLQENFNSQYLEFIFTWEKYEIVFQPLINQRYAIQEEYSSKLSSISDAVLNYDRYFNFCFRTKDNKELRDELIKKMGKLHKDLLDIAGCLIDIRSNLQNYVFKDVLELENPKRKVLDSSIPTIETLVEKYKDKI